MKNETKIQNQNEAVGSCKKTNKKGVWAILGIILATVVVLVIVIAVKVLVVGNKATIDVIAFDTISVENNKLILHGTFVDSITAWTRVRTKEEDGVVTIDIYGAPTSIFGKNEIVLNETFDNNIHTIYIGEHIIYDHGVVIDKKVSKLYAEKTPYIGDISEVNQVINESGVCELFDIGNKSLETTKEPYCLTFYINNTISGEREELLQCYMKDFSAVLISCIGNLSNVNWKYTIYGENKNYLVTSEEVCTLVGENIKDISVTPSKLQNAMEELEILDLSNAVKVWED